VVNGTAPGDGRKQDMTGWTLSVVNAPLIDIDKRLAAVRAKIREVIAQIATEGRQKR
jgi:hypothetical protein